MSHIRVDNDMHRRIMNAVSEAISENSRTKEDNNLSSLFDISYVKAGELPRHLNDETHEDAKEAAEEIKPVRRKAKVSVIKVLSIAAAAILVAGGAVMLATRFIGQEKSAVMNEAGVETRPAVDAEMRTDDFVDADSHSRNYLAGTNSATTGASESDNGYENEDEIKSPGTAPDEALSAEETKADLKDSLSFKVKTVGTGTMADKSIMTKVYTGENGEKMILFTAKEGTDIVKAYFPGFKGIPALLQTESGQVFNGIDTSVGKKERVNLSGPFDAVTWTKDGNSYMLVFNTKTDVQVFISIMEKI